MLGRIRKSKYGSLAKSYGGLSASAKRKRARSQKTFGKKNLSSNTRGALSFIKTKTQSLSPAASPFNIGKPKTPSAFSRNPIVSTKPAPAVVKKPKFAVLIPRPPAPAPPPPQPKPQPKPSFVKRQQPKPKAVIKSRPANVQPKGASLLQHPLPLTPMGMRDDVGDRASQTIIQSNPLDNIGRASTVRSGDKGYSDVVKYTPPPPKPRKNRSGFVPSKPVGRLQPDESRVNNADIIPIRIQPRPITPGIAPSVYDRDIGDAASRTIREFKPFEKRGRASNANDLVVSSPFTRGNDPIRDAIIEDRETRLRERPLDIPKVIPKIVPASLDILTVNVKTIPSNCEVLVDGVLQKVTKLTPTILTFSAKEVLGRSKTITVRRIGYKSNEAYKVVGRIKREEKVIEKRVLDDTFDDDFIEYEPSFVRGGLNPMMEGRFTQAGGLLGGEGFGFNRMREERNRIRERRNVKPRYKTIKEKIINL